MSDDGPHSDGYEIGYSEDPCPEEAWSELGMAHRLVTLCADSHCYVPAWNKWHHWNGTYWKDDVGEVAISRAAQDLVMRMERIAAAIPDEKESKAKLQLARSLQSLKHTNAIVTYARTAIPPITGEQLSVTPAQFDADPYLLNCTNGVLDLRTGELLEHDPLFRLTKVCGAPYDPDAIGTQFRQFFGRVQPAPAMRSYIQRLIGCALEGRVTEQILPLWYGSGANGKGTMANLVLKTLGDYAEVGDPDLLTNKESHPTGIADLFGRRLVILNESGEDGRVAISENLIKRLTGNDRLKARRMRENWWAFDPTHLFIVLLNDKPAIRGKNEGIWRRPQVVPWDVIIPSRERDYELIDRLLLEKAYVLSWIVDGYQEWKRSSLKPPSRAIAATDEYRSDSDPVYAWLRDCCLDMRETEALTSTESTLLYESYEEWRKQFGARALTQTAFGRDLSAKGYRRGQAGDGKRVRYGIRLNSQP